MPEFNASKIPDIGLIDRLRFFLIRLLVGKDIQVMINIKMVDGVIAIDKKGLVCDCLFVRNEDLPSICKEMIRA